MNSNGDVKKWKEMTEAEKASEQWIPIPKKDEKIIQGNRKQRRAWYAAQRRANRKARKAENAEG